MHGCGQENCASNAGTKCRAARIAELNDALRQYRTNDKIMMTNGKILMTRGITDAFRDQWGLLVDTLANFNDFDEDNNPHGERDMGGFDLNGHTVLWKIDYYDMAMEYGSDDPTDPAVTMRVLTIMLASEY